MLDAAERTHPRIVSPTGARRPNGRFQQAADFEALPPAPDPLEQTTPMIELVDRSAAEARGALIQIGLDRVADTILDDLLLGVTVAVSNAQTHGRPPATVRIWATPDRIVISVHDQGRGPADPLARLFRPPRDGNTRTWAMDHPPTRHRRRTQPCRRRLHDKAARRHHHPISQRGTDRRARPWRRPDAKI